MSSPRELYALVRQTDDERLLVIFTRAKSRTITPRGLHATGWQVCEQQFFNGNAIAQPTTGKE